MNSRQRRVHRRAVADLIGRPVLFAVPGMEWRRNYPHLSGVVQRVADGAWRSKRVRWILGVWVEFDEREADCPPMMFWVPMCNLRAMAAAA